MQPDRASVLLGMASLLQGQGQAYSKPTHTHTQTQWQASTYTHTHTHTHIHSFRGGQGVIEGMKRQPALKQHFRESRPESSKGTWATRHTRRTRQGIGRCGQMCRELSPVRRSMRLPTIAACRHTGCLCMWVRVSSTSRYYSSIGGCGHDAVGRGGLEADDKEPVTEGSPARHGHALVAVACREACLEGREGSFQRQVPRCHKPPYVSMRRHTSA